MRCTGYLCRGALLWLAISSWSHAADPCLKQQDVASTDPGEIGAAVEQLISDRVLLRADRVSVNVTEGTAALSGVVSNLLTSKLAAQAAADVKGVQRVVNNIAVRPPGRRAPDQIENSIVQALVASPATESFQVDIEASPDGAVSLSGTVDSRAERDLVQRAAESVLGVTSVNNQLEVRRGRTRLDSEIAAEVERTLQWNASIDSSRIDVQVRDGVVALSGWVESAADKMHATSLAWTAGTRDVDAQQLKVSVARRTAEPRPDAAPRDCSPAGSARGS